MNSKKSNLSENENIYLLNNVSKTYKNFSGITHALNKVTFNIKKGEILVILGPSGSGKSTLLNILSGIDNVTSGTIKFNDSCDISKLSGDNMISYRRDNLGFIFQSYNLVPNLTVYENLEFGGHLSNDNLDIDDILKVVGLYEMKDKFPCQLSGGQMQRVAIARAVVKNPKVLFCDEPTGALDEKTGKQTLKLLQEINKKYGTTIIIVTHNPSISNMANTTIKLNSGVIVETIYNNNVLDAESIGWA